MTEPRSLPLLNDAPAPADQSLGARLQELFDRDELRELVARYAHRVTHRLSVAEMFTDDGAFILHQPGRPLIEARGRQQLDSFMSMASPAAPVSYPMIHNHLIRIAGDEARGLCSLEVRSIETGESVIGSGYYDDSYRRESGRWKFVTREVTMFHMVPLSQGWA